MAQVAQAAQPKRATQPIGRVLVLGADGFIGRHIAFALRRQGVRVLASARRTSRLQAMGFETLRANLTDKATHDAAFWHPYLADGTHVVNAAGLLSGPERQMQAVHVDAPKAVYAAMQPGARGVLISAAGIAAATTRFAQTKTAGEAVAAAAQTTVLRPGLVMADTSYGGTSLARALAVLPFATPVIGTGKQVFNPIHADDLAAAVIACLHSPPGAGPHEIGGPERITQAQLLAKIRAWLGLNPVRVLRLPLPLARALGKLGDALRLGPISRTAVTQLEHGIEADETPLCTALNIAPRGLSKFMNARAAGSQDLWHARLYLMRPLLRIVLAFMWASSGLIGLSLAPEAFLPLINSALPDETLIATARIAGLIDLGFAVALLRNWHPQLIGALQFTMVLGYTIAFTLLAPALWLLPLGGVLKNLPILALIAVATILESER